MDLRFSRDNLNLSLRHDESMLQRFSLTCVETVSSKPNRSSPFGMFWFPSTKSGRSLILTLIFSVLTFSPDEIQHRALSSPTAFCSAHSFSLPEISSAPEKVFCKCSLFKHTYIHTHTSCSHSYPRRHHLLPTTNLKRKLAMVYSNGWLGRQDETRG